MAEMRKVYRLLKLAREQGLIPWEWIVDETRELERVSSWKVLDAYGVGFRVMHGFSGATSVYDIAQDDDGRPLIALYVGDYDPSGIWMSVRDLPERLKKYGGEHVEVIRVALDVDQLVGLPSFPASDKKSDAPYKWFVDNYGDHCWEPDAMDPNDLRAAVRSVIEAAIEPEAWNRCLKVNKAEQESLRSVLDSWKAA